MSSEENRGTFTAIITAIIDTTERINVETYRDGNAEPVRGLESRVIELKLNGKPACDIDRALHTLVRVELLPEPLWRGPPDPHLPQWAGLSVSERCILKHLGVAWSMWCDLPNKHPDDPREFRDHLHTLQNLVAWRVARRVDPSDWR